MRQRLNPTPDLDDRAPARTLRRADDRASSHPSLALQRLAGNRAVVRALNAVDTSLWVDRQERDDPVDAELDRILADLVTKEPQIPAFEVITATGATDFSRGEFERRIQELWKRKRMSFTSAARMTAKRNDSGRGAPVPTQSPDLARKSGTRFARRAAVGLFAANYEKGSDLPAVAALVRKGSPMMASLRSEFPSVDVQKDPSASRMSAAIFDAILELWTANAVGEIAQLVVYFSGHGGGGSIGGVDGQNLGPDDLESLAMLGRDFGVHVVYVLDTCRAGLLIPWAQGTAMADIAGDAEKSGDKRTLASVELLREFVRIGWTIGAAGTYVGNRMRRVRSSVPTKQFPAFFDDYKKLIEGLDNLQDLIETTKAPPPGADLAKVKTLIDEARLHIVFGFGGRKAAVTALLKHISALLDALNDTVNASILALHPASSGSSTQPADGAGSSAD